MILRRLWGHDLLKEKAAYFEVARMHVIAMVEATIGNVNHLSKSASLYVSCESLVLSGPNA
jgi:hypothetical protein